MGHFSTLEFPAQNKNVFFYNFGAKIQRTQFWPIILKVTCLKVKLNLVSVNARRQHVKFRSPPKGKMIAAKEGGLIDKQLSNILQ